MNDARPSSAGDPCRARPSRLELEASVVCTVGLLLNSGKGKRMRIRRHFHTLPLVVLLGSAAAADAQVQPKLAQQWFEEATKLCERDAGRLWGVSLCGPMVIFDQRTGTRATSQPE